jgi:acyl-CoA thioester hydrolase
MPELDIKPTSEELLIDGVIHPSPFQCEINVLPEQSSAEVDHVNNIEYIRWIDKGAQLHCDACGWTREQLLLSDVMWFVGRHEVDYRAEATLRDKLILTTWVEDIRRVKSNRTTLIHAIREKPVLVCQSKTLWVLVDVKTKRPCPVPSEMATALSPLTKPRLARK